MVSVAHRDIIHLYSLMHTLIELSLSLANRSSPDPWVVCGPHEAQHGMGWAVGERNLIFYADDGRIVRRDHICVQEAMMVSVAMFQRVALGTNLYNTKSLVCTPG